MQDDSLTTESLRKKFKNNFNLCNFSIRIGRTMIIEGSQAKLADVLKAVEERVDLDAAASKQT